MDYDTAWARRYPVRLARAVVVDNVTRPLAHAVASPDVRGDELLSLAEAPVILVANHTSHARHRAARLGAPSAPAALHDRRGGRRLLLRPALEGAHVGVSHRGHPDRAPAGQPEVGRPGCRDCSRRDGTCSSTPKVAGAPTGGCRTFRPGAAYLAVRTGRPVVPVHLDGTCKVMARDGGRVRRSPTTVTFGLPIGPEPGEDARAFGRRIEKAVHLLATERTTDWWTARKQAARGTPSEAGGPEAAAWRRAWALGPAPGPRDLHRREWAIDRKRVRGSS